MTQYVGTLRNDSSIVLDLNEYTESVLPAERRISNYYIPSGWDAGPVYWDLQGNHLGNTKNHELDIMFVNGIPIEKFDFIKAQKMNKTIEISDDFYVHIYNEIQNGINDIFNKFIGMPNNLSIRLAIENEITNYISYIKNKYSDYVIDSFPFDVEFGENTCNINVYKTKDL